MLSNKKLIMLLFIVLFSLNTNAMYKSPMPLFNSDFSQDTWMYLFDKKITK